MVKKTKKVYEENAMTISGKRKRAIAKATIRPGTGKIRINKKLIESYSYLRQLSLKEPLIIAKEIIQDQLNKIDISVNVKGGGVESQVEATRLSISRSLVEFTKNEQLRKAFINYDRSLLVADVRRKEPNKPGDSKARAKRQKSYR